MKIVIIDDLQFNLDFFEDVLKHHFEVHCFTGPKAAINFMNLHQPDLVVLDCVMPGQDGFTTYLQIKHLFPKVPVIMVSGYRIEDNLVRALDMHVDDFVYRPIGQEEFIARIKNKILKSKRIKNEMNNIDQIDFVKFDDLNETVIFEEEIIPLKSKEYRLLKFLACRRDQLVTRDEIFLNVWEDIYVSPATLDTHMCQLRKKLNNHANHILTRKNIGFIFSTSAHEVSQ